MKRLSGIALAGASDTARAQDSDAIGPALRKTVEVGIPVVGYDRLIGNPAAFSITHARELGKRQAGATPGTGGAGTAWLTRCTSESTWEPRPSSRF